MEWAEFLEQQLPLSTLIGILEAEAVYLDRLMKTEAPMQGIARADRVFPEKDNGLTVDYVGVFRNLEKALAVYAAAETGQSPRDHRVHRRALTY